MKRLLEFLDDEKLELLGEVDIPSNNPMGGTFPVEIPEVAGVLEQVFNRPAVRFYKINGLVGKLEPPFFIIPEGVTAVFFPDLHYYLKDERPHYGKPKYLPLHELCVAQYFSGK